MRFGGEDFFLQLHDRSLGIALHHGLELHGADATGLGDAKALAFPVLLAHRSFPEAFASIEEPWLLLQDCLE